MDCAQAHAAWFARLGEGAPRIETERLILRMWQLGDFERYFGLFGDAEAARHMGGASTRGVAWRRFVQIPGAWSLQGFGMFAVEEKSSGRWVGQAGPWQPDGWPGAEIGYAFHPDAQGQGYATEACSAAIDWAFDALGWSEVIHSIGIDNRASQRVAEKLGSAIQRRIDNEAPFEGYVVDVWGQRREHWLARKPLS